jgi:hypothetical protein
LAILWAEAAICSLLAERPARPEWSTSFTMVALLRYEHFYSVVFSTRNRSNLNGKLFLDFRMESRKQKNTEPELHVCS